ncbi:MAG: sigma 54-interacting transcriptional regulator [Polyangiaceae bacterium]|nr:sigma 54-interacting transcriptional regulator [Polyangiaceae bacterium]
MSDNATRPNVPMEIDRVSLELIALSGDDKGKHVALPFGKRVRVGKSSENDLSLVSDTVSRLHCEFVYGARGVAMEDLGSTNGTKVNASSVKSGVFPTGTIFRIGEVELLLRVSSSVHSLLPSERKRFGEAFSNNSAMRTVFSVLENVAKTDATVLLQGETGTGKDVVARSIHAESKRSQGPFVVLDCGAISYSLLESELFGHEKGAFTGAHAQRLGAFEMANKGTLFLDEIGELPLEFQPKLLRALETREFRRVGGNVSITSDVRFVAATKRDLKREVEGGRFREDLFYRLSVVEVYLPPLRERREDLELLAQTFWGDEPLPPEMLSSLATHEWNGNVRELRHYIERAKLLGAGAMEFSSGAGPRSSNQNAFVFTPTKSYRETRAEFDAQFEKTYVEWLLARHNGNVTQAAKEAKMDRKYLSDLVKKHELG